MAEIVLLLYAVVGVWLGVWLSFHGPVRPDNVVKLSAVVCIVLLWPFFVLHTLRS